MNYLKLHIYFLRSIRCYISPLYFTFHFCKIHGYMAKITLSSLLTWMSFFYIRFADFWYIACFVPNLMPVWPQSSLLEVMYVEKLNEFNLSEEGKEFEQQRKSFDSENRRSEDLIETLKDPNDVYECIITLLSSLNVSKEIKLSQWF